MIYLLPLIILMVLVAVFFLFDIKPNLQGDDWFSRSSFDNSWWILPSLLATNIGLAGGIIASISGAKYYGWWFLAAPISAAIGLLSFVSIRSKLANMAGNGRLFLSDIIGDRFSSVYAYFCASSALILAFVAGWEIHVATQIIVSFYAPLAFVAENSMLVSFVLAGVAGLYIAKGGWERSVFTDIIQFLGILIFMGLLWYSLGGAEASFVKTVESPDIGKLPLALFCVALLVNNIAFSLISPGNWQIARSANDKAIPVFVIGAFLLVAFTCAVFFLSRYVEGSPFEIFSKQTYATAVMLSLVPLFVWSSIDTFATAITCLADDMVNRYTRGGVREHFSQGEYLRKNVPLLFLIAAVAIAGLLNAFLPNIFFALLAATSSLAVYIPIVLAPLFTKNVEFLYTNKYGLFVFLLFLLSLISSLIFSLMGFGEWLFALALLGMLLSAACTVYYCGAEKGNVSGI